MNSNEIKPGQVVTIDSRKRRYVVTFVCKRGTVNMVALSGAVSGCGPSSVLAERLTLDADQTVSFSGAKAQYLSNRVEQYRAWGQGAFGGQVIS